MCGTKGTVRIVIITPFRCRNFSSDKTRLGIFPVAGEWLCLAIYFMSNRLVANSDAFSPFYRHIHVCVFIIASNFSRAEGNEHLATFIGQILRRNRF